MARWLVLNTDASKPEPSGAAAIGVILRQKPRPTATQMRVVAYISEVVGLMEIQAAEYCALIEGLKLALRHHPDDLQVFTDSAIVADQVQLEAPKMKLYMKPLHEEVQQLLDKIGREKVRISWLPREQNREADQRASDAFFKPVGNAWVSPESSLFP